MSDSLRVLVTGAKGFVGRAVLKALLDHRDRSLDVVAAVRSEDRSRNQLPCRYQRNLELNSDVGWDEALIGVDVVIHCAARVHVMAEKAADPLAEFRRVNVEGTLRLARLAHASGVRRFVYLSSVKVHGESTTDRSPFRGAEMLAPSDPYAVSKAEAEQKLSAFCRAKGMELVIVRPPLVYGPGVKGNFLSLMKLASSSLPLPFGAVKNQRSMVYVDNLAHFLVCCATSSLAAGKAFLVSDGEDLSLAGLLAALRRSLGKGPLLVPIPIALFRFAGWLIRKQSVVERLVGSLQVDCGEAVDALNWAPPYSVEQALQKTVDYYRAR
ncbi:NAD-dependent epimerase/dehydratase family protein [Marinobacter sediminum]|uniref:NAD-dependent epimerase/dehydratase family protein n=1 Tax=Marinobacter sediminum TaxID=256323 RepID=UPI0030842D47